MLPVASGALAQQGWPNKPIRFVVPFPPGGTTDIIGRIAADEVA
ncbi:MAG TPA: tripartite tricarboxylate transporter substrate binding protein, partial [Burkholderiaceae bacterium]|nr:tripartite tricarboxylate transporter substrate binding protein [Burkholderiaceae bacterium]